MQSRRKTRKIRQAAVSASPQPSASQMIMACPVCGAANGNCEPEPHREGAVPMSREESHQLKSQSSYVMPPSLEPRCPKCGHSVLAFNYSTCSVICDSCRGVFPIEERAILFPLHLFAPFFAPAPAQKPPEEFEMHITSRSVTRTPISSGASTGEQPRECRFSPSGKHVVERQICRYCDDEPAHPSGPSAPKVEPHEVGCTATLYKSGIHCKCPTQATETASAPIITMREKKRKHIITISISFASGKEATQATFDAHIAAIRATCPGAEVVTSERDEYESAPSVAGTQPTPHQFMSSREDFAKYDVNGTYLLRGFEIEELLAKFGPAQGTSQVQETLKDFVESYRELNGVSKKLSTPKYDQYVQGASDFADFLETHLLGASTQPGPEEKR